MNVQQPFPHERRTAAQKLLDWRAAMQKTDSIISSPYELFPDGVLIQPSEIILRDSADIVVLADMGNELVIGYNTLKLTPGTALNWFDQDTLPPAVVHLVLRLQNEKPSSIFC